MKFKLLCLLTLVLFSSNTFAQIGFENHIIIDRSFGIDGATSVYSADIDGDGDMDVLSASANDNKIAWYENTNGQGSFGLPTLITINAMQARSVHAADIDGDGDIDVLSASQEDHKIAWYENTDGQGNFGEQLLISADTSIVNDVFAADVDGDGDMDVLSAFGDTIAWYENINGLGDFGVPQNITTNAIGARSVYADDMDGDGDVDVLSASFSDDKIAWYENTDGQGNFGDQLLITTNADGASSVYTTDVDGDGDKDVLSASSNDGKIAWYENTDGTGNFGDQLVLTTNAEGAGGVFAADVDGDGDQDILSAATDEVKVAWYENTDGLGSFGSQQTITTYADGTNSVIATDIDGDGDQDVLTAFDNKIGLYENLDGQGDDWLPQIVSVSAFGAYGVFPGDMDGDGDKDVISASQNDGKIAWYENTDGAGNFGMQRLIINDAYNVRYVSSGDLDGDGDLDVLSASSLQGNKTAWYENLDGQGNFGPPQIIATSPEDSRAVLPTDLDGDGDLDLLTASYDDNKIAWHENMNGQGNFGAQQVITTQAIQAIDIYVTDIDDDGDMDVLSASLIDDKIAWYENINGQGSFGAQQVISDNVLNAKTVFADDIDGDGDMDVLTTGSSGVQAVWFENMDGQGTFGEPHIIANALSANRVFSGDMDGDGDKDVIASFSTGDKVVWYENYDGLGSFGAQQIITDDVNLPRSIFVDDMDGDGDMDVLSASQFDDKVAWYENLNLVSNTLSGIVRLDLSSNSCDPDNSPMRNVKVVTSNGTDSIATFTLNSGYYQLYPGEGDYTTSLTSMLPNYFSVDPNAYSSSFSGIGNADYGDFCVESIEAVNDLNISCYPTNEARPGFEATYRLVYHNIGNTVLSGSVVLAFDDTKMNFLNANQVVSSQTNNSVTFEYTNLNPFETRWISLTFYVLPPPTVNIDDILSFTATINPLAGDLTEADNSYSFDQIVIGSFDPNDISVLEGDQVLIDDADKYLHYIIRFQNTGTAEAIHVRVENTLDPNLDWNTFQPENISHLNRIEITEGNKVAFIFNNIFLPDSTTNEPASHGFIAYKIRPKSDIAIGESISNNANIFFDFNLPITTNTVVTEFVTPSSTGEISALHFSVYPVPASHILWVESPTPIAQIKIYDRLGKLMLFNTNEKKMDISALSQGFYFCKVVDEFGNFGIQKVVKK